MYVYIYVCVYIYIYIYVYVHILCWDRAIDRQTGRPAEPVLEGAQTGSCI